MLDSGDRRRDLLRAERGAAERRRAAGRRPGKGASMPPRAVQWHYADIDYGGYLLGLLVETGDECVARREAEAVCNALGNCARVLNIRRAVIR